MRSLVNLFEVYFWSVFAEEFASEVCVLLRKQPNIFQHLSELIAPPRLHKVLQIYGIPSRKAFLSAQKMGTGKPQI